MPGSSFAAQPEHETISVKRITVLPSQKTLAGAMSAERRTGVVLLSITSTLVQNREG
jgi:hypothetical protein